MVQHRGDAAGGERVGSDAGFRQTPTHGGKVNRKQLTVLLVLVLVLGGAGLLIRNKENAALKSGDPVIGKKLLGEFPVNDVAHIAIKQDTNELNLVKKDDLWRVRERSEYPANYTEISDFLLKARDLKIVQHERVGPTQLPRLSLVAGRGTDPALTVDLIRQPGKASGVANPLSSPGFVDVLPSAKPEALGLDKPTVVTVGTFDNFTYTLKVGQKTNDDFPLAMTVSAQFQKERTPGKDEKPED